MQRIKTVVENRIYATTLNSRGPCGDFCPKISLEQKLDTENDVKFFDEQESCISFLENIQFFRFKTDFSKFLGWPEIYFSTFSTKKGQK